MEAAMKDLSNINNLSTEVKVAIVQGQATIEKAQKVMEKYKYDFDLTSKRELKTDIKHIEKYMLLIENGKVTEKNIKELEKSITKLNTVVDGLVHFFGTR